MIVCVCKGVSDRQIEKALEEGASTFKEVARCTRAGTGCGCCHASIRDVIERSEDGSGRSPLLPLLAAGAS